MKLLFIIVTILLAIAILLLLKKRILLKKNQIDRIALGDILFQRMNCGPICDAIETVTDGYKGQAFSHVGIVVQNTTKELMVFEAFKKRVVEIPLENFLSRSLNDKGIPQVMVSRIRKPFSGLIPKIMSLKNAFLDLPYNHTYVMNVDSYYCSQLLYDLFKKANNNHDFFELSPMTFKEPGSNNYAQAWIDYYHELGIPIPEGEPGINPGGLSKSKKLKVLFRFRQPL